MNLSHKGIEANTIAIRSEISRGNINEVNSPAAINSSEKANLSAAQWTSAVKEDLDFVRSGLCR
jgi:hypothetical protein